MTLFEFKHWMDGFLSALSGPPDEAQRAVVAAKLDLVMFAGHKILAQPTQKGEAKHA